MPCVGVAGSPQLGILVTESTLAHLSLQLPLVQFVDYKRTASAHGKVREADLRR